MAVTGNKTYFEYRGVSNAVYAEVTQDNASGITFGQVKNFTGVSEIGKETESSNEPHYYDNLPVIVVNSTGSDEISINASGIPFDVLAEITGQYYDENTGMMVEQERTPKYFAFGYITQKTDGTEVLVWRLKGSFSIPSQTSATQDDGTDANGQELTYTGISTTYKFNANNAPAKAVNIDTSVNLTMSAEAFFDTVQTPDTVAGSGSTTYTLTFNVNGGTAIGAMTYAAGSYVTLPTPTYAGHTFDGWYTNSELTGSPVTGVAMTANTTVYAKWTENA